MRFCGVSSPAQRYTVSLGSADKAGQLFFVQLVAGDNVWINCCYEARQACQHGRLLMLAATDDFLKTGAIAYGNREQSVIRLLSAEKKQLWAVSWQISKKGDAAADQKLLATVRNAKPGIWRGGLLQVAAEELKVMPVGKFSKPAECTTAGKTMERAGNRYRFG